MKKKKKEKKRTKKRISVGKDEFCSKCMEWREYDEDGRCKICGKHIKKIQTHKANYDEYRIEGVADEIDEEMTESEFE